MVGQTVDVGEVTDPAEVDEAGERLFGDAIDVHAGFRHEAGVLLQLFGRAGGIGAMQGASAALLTRHNLSGVMTHGALFRNMQGANGLNDLDDFRNNLVRLDDRKLCASIANAQSFALADVAE